MIVNLKVSNFFSFFQKNEIPNEMSFVVGKKARRSHYDINVSFPQEMRLNKVLAVIGANGAGKTQLVRVLPFLAWFITESAREIDSNENIPVMPHMLFNDIPISFVVEFLLDGVLYRYRLVLKDNTVLHESLYEKTSRFSYIFMRDRTDDGYLYKQKSHFGFAAKQARSVRKNVSLLSSAHMHDVHESVKFINFFKNIVYNVTMMGREPFHSYEIFNSAHFVYHHKEIREQIESLLCNMDLGLSKINYVEEKLLTNGGEKDIDVILPLGVHRTERGEEFKLPFFRESSGTQSAYMLLRVLLPVLQKGGIAVIDELDNDLHPHMLPKILELFKSKESNPHDAQLLFSCHAVEVLNELAKHQVYLVEKKDLTSDTWRLDEMEGLRADDNLYAKYLSGALGAVPNI